MGGREARKKPGPGRETLHTREKGESGLASEGRTLILFGCLKERSCINAAVRGRQPAWGLADFEGRHPGSRKNRRLPGLGLAGVHTKTRRSCSW